MQARAGRRFGYTRAIIRRQSHMSCAETNTINRFARIAVVLVGARSSDGPPISARPPLLAPHLGWANLARPRPRSP